MLTDAAAEHQAAARCVIATRRIKSPQLPGLIDCACIEIYVILYIRRIWLVFFGLRSNRSVIVYTARVDNKNEKQDECIQIEIEMVLFIHGCIRYWSDTPPALGRFSF